jgi:5-methylcytosine-specific restriction protein A
MPTAPPTVCTTPLCPGKRQRGEACPVCGKGGKREAQRAHDARRGSARERGYDSRWDKFRLQFLRMHPLCAGPHSQCAAEGRVTAATVVDHRDPHRGDMVKFWAGPFDPLCTRCHNIKTAKGL